MVSADHDMAVPVTHAQPLWLPVQDQDSQRSTMAVGRAHPAPSLSEKLLAVDGCWGRGLFLQWYDHWQVAHDLVIIPHLHLHSRP